MPHDRFYTPSRIIEGSTHVLSEKEHVHLAKVMRKSCNDTIELIDGQGHLALATISGQTRTTTTVQVSEILETHLPSAEMKVLILAYLRPALMEFALEKSIEVGVNKILFYPGDLSKHKELSSHQLERFHAIVIASMKQCGCLFLPQIEIKPPLNDWIEALQPLYYGDHRAQQQITSPYGSICIGPEAGFSHREKKLLEEKAQGVSLHPHILRAETAAIVGVVSFYRNR